MERTKKSPPGMENFPTIRPGAEDGKKKLAVKDFNIGMKVRVGNVPEFCKDNPAIEGGRMYTHPEGEVIEIGSIPPIKVRFDPPTITFFGSSLDWSRFYPEDLEIIPEV